MDCSVSFLGKACRYAFPNGWVMLNIHEQIYPDHLVEWLERPIEKPRPDVNSEKISERSDHILIAISRAGGFEHLNLRRFHRNLYRKAKLRNGSREHLH